MSRTSFDLITIDTEKTDALALFWSQAMGLHESEREDGDRWIVLSDETGVRRMGFQRGVNGAGAIHLDLACSLADFDAERERLLQIGARETRPPRTEPYGRIANMADSDGNLFDLCAYVS